MGARIDGNDKGQTGRWYWYGEHDVDTDQLGFDGYKLDRSRQRYQGGSVSCSTNDMKSWKNEGTMVSRQHGVGCSRTGYALSS